MAGLRGYGAAVFVVEELHCFGAREYGGRSTVLCLRTLVEEHIRVASRVDPVGFRIPQTVSTAMLLVGRLRDASSVGVMASVGLPPVPTVLSAEQ